RERRGEASDLSAAGMGGPFRSRAIHLPTDAEGGNLPEHGSPALPREALRRAQVARSRLSSVNGALERPYAGRWWHMLEDGRLQCDLCPRDCRLHEGQRGACFVRMRENNEMVLTTYGRSSGFCIDPVEEKPLNHFYPGSSI